MSEGFQIGVTDLSSSRFVKKSYARLEPGDNLHRVLPPVHSLAAKGRFSQYWAFHGGFKDSAGHGCMFQCIEEVDRKTKLIKVHCPQCDYVRENKARYDQALAALKAGQAGITKDQVDKFYQEYVFQYQVQKGFFLNTINIKNELKVLQIPYKSNQALEFLLNKLKEAGVDPTGVRGAYINFQKQQAFKGDSQTTYPVTLALEGDIMSGQKPKLHELTADIINTMATGTADLASLYVKISAEDIVALLSAPLDQRGKLADRIFGRGQDNKAQDATPGNVSTIPGTVAQAVSRVEVNPQGVNLAMPDVGGVKQSAPTQPAPMTNSPQQIAALGLGAPAPAAAPALAPATTGPVDLRDLTSFQGPQAAAPAPAIAPATTQAAPAQAAPAPASPTPGFMGQSQIGQGVTQLKDTDFMGMFAPAQVPPVTK